MRLLVVSALVLAWASVAMASDECSDSHRKAAGELLVLSGAEQNALVGASAMADAMLQTNPMLAPYRDVLVAWSGKVMTWDNMKPRFVALYCEHYSEQELRELIAFYETPLGKKTLEVTPEIMRRSALIGGELANEHSAELQAMIRERTAELERSQQPEESP
jgi:hypothetical protein